MDDARLSPLLMADALIDLAARAQVLSVVIEPTQDEAHEVLTVREGTATLNGKLPSTTADAVVARLALLARLEIGGEGERLGRLPVEIDGRAQDMLVIVNQRPRGLAVEIRAVTTLASMRPPSPAPGRLPLPARIGPYSVLKEVGRGAMGVVYSAEHVVLQRPAAIKVLRPELSQRPEQVARFLNEARAASRPQHPGVVGMIDFGTTDDGRMFLVMELVSWPTLATVLARGTPRAVQAVAVARRIAEALHAVHEHGVVHRDLKPANVFVGPEDQVKIADFGAAKLMRGQREVPVSDTQRGVFYGTPQYMSPEHAGGISTDRRTDLYALGCLLFEMLTGRVPYLGNTTMEILVQHASAPIPRPESPYGLLPQVLHRTIERALAKDPSQRYQTAPEFIADLEHCASALGRKGWRAWLPT